MNTVEKILGKLKDRGYRMTNVRRTIAGIMVGNGSPMPITEIEKKLSKGPFAANKTTIYREMSVLEKEGIVTIIQFGDGKARYEITRDHHHHVVCVKCDDVADVEVKGDLMKEQRLLEIKSRFKILRHHLEFFGLCNKCTT